MKLIVDIDEDYYKIIKHDVDNGMDYLPCVLIANGIPIPDNATNGDVIDAMFPNVDFVTDVFGGFNFPKWWWNALYKKDGK